MTLTAIEKQNLGNVLGYDTSDCTSRTRSGVLKWIINTYSDVERSDLEKKLPLEVSRLDGSTDYCNWLVGISDIGELLEKEFGCGDDTWDCNWGEDSKWIYEWYFEVNGCKFSVYKLWDSEGLEVGIENIKKKDTVMRQIRMWVTKDRKQRSTEGTKNKEVPKKPKNKKVEKVVPKNKKVEKVVPKNKKVEVEVDEVESEEVDEVESEEVDDKVESDGEEIEIDDDIEDLEFE
jgi:hypothetical protein